MIGVDSVPSALANSVSSIGRETAVGRVHWGWRGSTQMDGDVTRDPTWGYRRQKRHVVVAQEELFEPTVRSRYRGALRWGGSHNLSEKR